MSYDFRVFIATSVISTFSFEDKNQVFGTFPYPRFDRE